MNLLRQPLRIAVAQIATPPLTLDPRDGAWLPSEPLRWELGLNAQSPSLRGLSLPGINRAHEEVARRVLENTTNRILQVVRWLADMQVDLVVLPELTVPPASIARIREQAGSMAVVAGIGYIRAADLKYLRRGREVDPRLNVGMNGAVISDALRLRFASKKQASRFERLDTPGSGPEVISLRKKSGVSNIGIGICLDALLAGASFGDDGAEIDVLAIPAWTPVVEDFNFNPRDFPVIFANSPFSGGDSQIRVSGLPEGLLATKEGTRPLPRESEGISIVDYFGAPSRPTPLHLRQSRLVARGGVTYAKAIGEDAETAKWLSRLDFDRYLRGEYTNDLRVRVGELRNAVLRESVQMLARVADGMPASRREFQALGRHPIIWESQSAVELEYECLEILTTSASSQLQTAEDDLELLARFLGSTRRRMKALAPQVRPSIRTQTDRYQTSTAPRTGDERSQVGPPTDSKAFFGARLGQFTTDNAIATLPAQLAVLEAMARYASNDIAIVHRLSTEVDDGGMPRAFFDVYGLVNTDDQERIDELSDSLGALMGVVFSGAWNLSIAPDFSLPRAEDGLELRLRSENKLRTVPEISEDWSAIVDLLRTQKSNTNFYMVCKPAWELFGGGGSGPVLSEDEFAALEYETLAEMTGVAKSMRDAALARSGFVTDAERRAAGYLRRIDEVAGYSAPKLVLSVVLAGESATPPLAHAIGGLVYGGAPFYVRSIDGLPLWAPPNSTGSTLSSAEVLRVLHPPYGPIQGRGLPSERRTRLPYRGSYTGSETSILGRARVHGPRSDKLVDVGLTTQERLRHVYVIGRTGSGKTNFLKNMVKRDLEAGTSTLVIDPHGDLAEYAAGNSPSDTPVLYLDFGSDIADVPNVDPFSLDSRGTSDVFDRNLDEAIGILRSLTHHQFTGPRFASLMRLTFRSLRLAPDFGPPSLATAARVLASSHERGRLASNLEDPDLQSRWRNLLAIRSGELEELIDWAVSKLAVYSEDERVNAAVGSSGATVSLEHVLKRPSACIIVRLPEWLLGSEATMFIGRLLMSRLRRFFFGQDRGGRDLRLALYIDEFQKFADTEFEVFLTEARKFGVALTLANQNLGQLRAFSTYEGLSSTRLEESIMGNAGTNVVFSIGSLDRNRMAAELDVRSEEVARVGRFEAIVRVRPIDSGGSNQAFTLLPPDARAFPPSQTRIARLAKSTFGRVSSRVLTTSDVGNGRSSAPSTDSSPVADSERREGSYGESSPFGASDYLEYAEELLSVDDSEQSAERAEEQVVRFISGIMWDQIPNSVRLRVASTFRSMEALTNVSVEEIVNSGIGIGLASRIYFVARAEWQAQSLVDWLTSVGLPQPVAQALELRFASLLLLSSSSDERILSVRGMGPARLAALRASISRRDDSSVLQLNALVPGLT